MNFIGPITKPTIMHPIIFKMPVALYLAWGSVGCRLFLEY